eukprot:TRINITY_DN37288_c0_g1_i1.p1 TRINITY_DN37288_c0_g1~~TRINITY_DN37288_c0_g1_i1.p1  ORF type:complete len:188 (+),score=28.11 TRINITY_DN37288_c0_g1_i1:59-565(+)
MPRSNTVTMLQGFSGLERGTKATVLEKRGEWTFVRSKEGSGWVPTNFLEWVGVRENQQNGQNGTHHQEVICIDLDDSSESEEPTQDNNETLNTDEYLTALKQATYSDYSTSFIELITALGVLDNFDSLRHTLIHDYRYQQLFSLGVELSRDLCKLALSQFINDKPYIL